MAKVKVHELAKELNIQSKEILQYLSEQNIEVKSHMSSIEDDVIKVVKKKFAKSETGKRGKSCTKGSRKGRRRTSGASEEKIQYYGSIQSTEQ